MLFVELSPVAASVMVGVWLFALGGAIGSFLNVVIYRLPAGLSLNHPGSHCPKCKHPIRWSDNVPILGWVALGGRCRDCKEPISARYPAVEALTACLFLLVGLVEGLSDGANLPLEAMGRVVDPGRPTFETYELAALVCLHLWVLCTLLAVAMIEYDGHRPPKSLLATAIVVGMLGATTLPALSPIVVWPGLEGETWRVCNSLAGLLLGVAMSQVICRYVDREKRSGLLGAGPCVGLVLGWQVIGTLLFATAMLQWIGRFVGPVRRVPPTAWLAVGTLAWILWLGRIVG